jgi:hypothetical protein
MYALKTGPRNPAKAGQMISSIDLSSSSDGSIDDERGHEGTEATVSKPQNNHISSLTNIWFTNAIRPESEDNSTGLTSTSSDCSSDDDRGYAETKATGTEPLRLQENFSLSSNIWFTNTIRPDRAKAKNFYDLSVYNDSAVFIFNKRIFLAFLISLTTLLLGTPFSFLFSLPMNFMIIIPFCAWLVGVALYLIPRPGWCCVCCKNCLQYYPDEESTHDKKIFDVLQRIDETPDKKALAVEIPLPRYRYFIVFGHLVTAIVCLACYTIGPPWVVGHFLPLDYNNKQFVVFASNRNCKFCVLTLTFVSHFIVNNAHYLLQASERYSVMESRHFCFHLYSAGFSL